MKAPAVIFWKTLLQKHPDARDIFRRDADGVASFESDGLSISFDPCARDGADFASAFAALGALAVARKDHVLRERAEMHSRDLGVPTDELYQWLKDREQSDT